ncbi:MAG: hypothetical protein ACK557_18895, partial [Planctomycetota bacterium]
MNKVEIKGEAVAVPASPTQAESAAMPSWGWPWDALTLVVPLVATLPWLRLEWLALQARQERWFGAGVVGLVLLGSILTQLLGKRGADGLESAWLELFLRNSSGGRAWVCFSSFDSVGRPYS